MIVNKKILFFMLLLISFSGIAYAAKGDVVYTKGSSDYFIVETPMGYSVLEWFGGNIPDMGDLIVGEFESYGMKDIYNLTDDAELKVWVEDFWLSKDRAIEVFYEHSE